METQLETLLINHFQPVLIEVDNESHLHSSGKGSESHFKVTLVSAAFVGMGLVARHRAVQAVLQPITQGKIHALGLHTYTPDEWQARGAVVPDSPACAGGTPA